MLAGVYICEYHHFGIASRMKYLREGILDVSCEEYGFHRSIRPRR
jgi:hypothetical protein